MYHLSNLIPAQKAKIHNILELPMPSFVFLKKNDLRNFEGTLQQMETKNVPNLGQDVIEIIIERINELGENSKSG